MGLVSKLKNILFEEEEVEIPVIEKKEKIATPVYKEMPKKEEPVKTEATYNYNRFYEEKRENTITEEKKQEDKIKYQEPVSDREIFKSENTFNFPSFDEKEFESVVPKRTTNVIEHERKKVEKRVEYKRPEPKVEEKPKNKFKPSPIISPVYGILDKNYTPDEITSREPATPIKTLDVDSVRKKAFGTLEEKEELKKVQTKQKELERQEKQKEQEESKILEEKLEKARTIDELLKDSSDDYIDLDMDVNEHEDQINTDDIDSLENIEPEHVDNPEEDTLESDLFDLIDSMYENREDGE